MLSFPCRFELRTISWTRGGDIFHDFKRGDILIAVLVVYSGVVFKSRSDRSTLPGAQEGRGYVIPLPCATTPNGSTANTSS